MSKDQDKIELIECYSDYINFTCNGVAYDVVPTWGNDLRDQIRAELSDRVLTQTYCVGETSHEYLIESEYLYEYPEVVRLWLRSNRQNWIEVTEE